MIGPVVLAAQLASFLLPAVSPPDLMLFSDGARWALFDPVSHQIRPIQIPSDLKVKSLSASRDGSVIVATATLEIDPTRPPALFQLDSSGGTARELSPDRGYFSDPAVEPDGSSVLVSYVPPNSGGPMNHDRRVFAEIYRFDFKRRTLEPVTAEPGCHVSPSAGPKGYFTFVHAACVMPVHWVQVQKRGSAARTIATDISARDPALSPDGKRLTYAHVFGGVLRIAEADLLTSKKLRDVEGLTVEDHPRPQFDDFSSDIYFHSAHAIWQIHGLAVRKVAVFEKESR